MIDTRIPRHRIVVVLLIAAVALGAVGYGLVSSWLRAEDESERADQAIVAAEELCRQVEAAGYTCVQDPEELRGDPGPEGPAGRGITSAECIAGQWVVTYSDGTVDHNAGDCTGDRGPPGTPGEDGSPGADGQDGQDGADSTQPGPPGTDGDDGRGITDAQCDPETGRWEITYSDGATEDGGPCIRNEPLGN